jgi:hypothetical protein
MLTSITQEIFASRSITANGALDLDVDVPGFVTVTGPVRMNGGAIALREGYTDGCVSISFQNLSGGESNSASACSYSSWQYELQLYEGIYRVIVVDGYYNETMLTAIPQTVIERIRF